MHVLVWILFGLIVGVVAKFLMRGRDPGAFVTTVVLGIVGAFVGGFLGRALGWYRDGDPVGFVMALLGAIVMLAIYRVTSPDVMNAGAARRTGHGVRQVDRGPHETHVAADRRSVTSDVVPAVPTNIPGPVGLASR